MRKLLLSLLLFAAICSNTKASNFSKLNEVNAEWKNNSDGQCLAASLNNSGNKTFNDWIATHLMLVEQTLRLRSVQQLNANQKANRFKLLDELQAYWHAGKFPVNDYLNYTNPVFIDRTGTHCAVGYLMQQSGAENLARSIDSDNKFVFVKSIRTKGVSEWASKNGFTIDELAWIQPGYPPTFSAQSMAGGLNGSVKCLIVDPVSQLLYAGGSFTASIQGGACNGIAAYISGIAGWVWVNVGGGVNGTVNAMLINNNKLYVGGEFTMAGSIPASNIAVFDLSNGQWQSMGNLDSSVNTLAVYNNEIYAGGKFSGMVSKWTGSQWQDITSGFIYNGEVRTLETYNNTLMIGGSFELLTGALRRNVATYDGTQMSTSGFGTVTPVNDFEIFHDTIYAACDVISGSDTCALARFVNLDWQVVIKPFNLTITYFDGTTIKKLFVGDDRLFGVGDFSCSSGLIYGNRMMEIAFDPSTGEAMCMPMIVIDSTVNTMIAQNNIVYFGGEFITVPGDTLNHVGMLFNLINSVSGAEKNISNSITVFPNPASDKINIELNDFSGKKECYIKIIDGTGREIYNQKIIQPVLSIDFTGNNSGVYLVQLVDVEGNSIGSRRIIVM